MKKIIMAVAAGALMMGAPLSVQAQVVDQAAAEAKARLACGAGTMVSAQYIGGGMLKVTCARQNQTSEQIAAESVLAGTGLLSPVAVGAVVTVVLIGLIGGTSTEPSPVSTTSSTSAPETGSLGER